MPIDTPPDSPASPASDSPASRASREATKTKRPRWKRYLARGTLGAFGLGAIFVTTVVVDGWRAIGTGASGARLERVEASPQWDDWQFANPQPIVNHSWLALSRMFRGSEYASPSAPVPSKQPPPSRFDKAPSSGLRITWLGHSSLLIEIDDKRFLTDPVWGPTPSPVTWLGPQRWYAPPIALEDLPSVDAVLISHDHYDHLDEPTISAISSWDTRFVVPLGVGAHLSYWGVDESKIDELDWWDILQFDHLRLTMTPARHASGRQIFDQNTTLWAGYALAGPKHRVFFSGDTGLFPGLREIGERLGPFDLSMLEVGAYDQAWPDWHLGPEQAVRAHQMLGAKVMLPIHWGLFDLALHGWTEPIERVLVEASAKGAVVATPAPGESFEPDLALPDGQWWPAVPWQSADEHPVVASGVDEND